MKFNVHAKLAYEVKSPGTLVINLHALRTPYQAVLEESFVVDPYSHIEELFSINGENRLIRLDLTEAAPLNIAYSAVVDNTYVRRDPAELTETPIGQLPPEVLPFLYPSRYCQSDKLIRLADNFFGRISHPYDKVRAIVDWIYNHVAYRSGSSNSETSAYDTVTQQEGVCRDFAHLGISLCRALTIPARYFTGYAYLLQPPDFHACFEAYLGGEWVLFDATKLVPINGLIKIATGRDAADTAIANIFGGIEFRSIEVGCDLGGLDFGPIYQ